ncbi:60S acidic ribosomal protein P1-like [Benincasa hispida]|uniref:60S acidic ribosomal protein P1-like n=1 Tax=Benincasa hispida TaxID=102211 RepID=UPI0018FF1D85|nr:60S acidic ribosomal protein P1-like [Benincasa hispida]
MSTGEIACSYAALILYDDNIPITAEKIATIVKAANVPDVESYWFGLFAKLAEKRNIGDLILNVGAGGGAAVAAAVPASGVAGGAAAAAAPPPEEKKEEPKEESDDDMGFSLFD